MIIHAIKDVVMYHPNCPGDVGLKVLVSKHGTEVVEPMLRVIERIVEERMRVREDMFIAAIDRLIDDRLNAVLDLSIVP